jgi:serine/threonine-protein kinase
MSEAAQTTAEFLRAVRASGLVEPEKLDPVVAPWEADAGAVPGELVAALVDGELLTAWQVDQLRRGRHKGFVLGKYKLLRLLGTGGMSSVYLAEHSTLHNKVAIKVLPVKRVDQSSYLARFEREAQASARLNHPHIARAFDLDTSGSIHFIVMEYIEGQDLHARVKESGPLPVREAADFLRQAALGLQYAHDEGLVHRDIKPANLIVDKRGHLKILDLGLALANAEDEGDASLTREHDEKVLGTADFLAPEQARDSHKADRRSDIYSLGCTLFYLLVGKPPYHTGSLAQRIRAHLNDPAPNILDFRSDVPPAIAELFFRMMEKHPDARQQSAQDVADALGAWLATNPATPGRGRAEPPPRRSDLRRGNPQSSAASPRRAATTAAGGAGEGDSAVGSGIGGEPSAAGGGSGSEPGSSVAGSHVQPGGGSSVSRGRDGSGRRSGSGIDPQSLSLTPPPSSPARSTGRLPQLARPAPAPSFPAAPAFPAATGGPGFKIDVTAAAAKPAPAEKPAAVKPAAAPRGPAATATPLARKVYGLPLFAWLGIGAVVIAAAGVGAWLLLAGAEAPEEGASRPASTARKPDKTEKKEESPPVRRRRSTTKPGEAPKKVAPAGGS